MGDGGGRTEAPSVKPYRLVQVLSSSLHSMQSEFSARKLVVGRHEPATAGVC